MRVGPTFAQSARQRPHVLPTSHSDTHTHTRTHRLLKKRSSAVLIFPCSPQRCLRLTPDPVLSDPTRPPLPLPLSQAPQMIDLDAGTSPCQKGSSHSHTQLETHTSSVICSKSWGRHTTEPRHTSTRPSMPRHVKLLCNGCNCNGCDGSHGQAGSAGCRTAPGGSLA